MTLPNVLVSKFVQTNPAISILGAISTPQPSKQEVTAWSRRPQLRLIETESQKQSVDAQPVPLVFKNVEGEFEVLVYRGEKCHFRSYCSNKNCVVKFSKWQARSFPYSCGVFYNTGDYLMVGEIEDNI